MVRYGHTFTSGLAGITTTRSFAYVDYISKGAIKSMLRSAQTSHPGTDAARPLLMRTLSDFSGDVSDDGVRAEVVVAEEDTRAVVGVALLALLAVEAEARLVVLGLLQPRLEVADTPDVVAEALVALVAVLEDIGRHLHVPRQRVHPRARHLVEGLVHEHDDGVGRHDRGTLSRG
jgi:hypothetical protein